VTRNHRAFDAAVHLSVTHPDRAWLTEVREALAYWESLPPTTPTSSVLGGGAVAAAEAAFSRVHADRPTLLLPSATYALRVGLQALGVEPGDEVICAGVDWPAGLAAIVSLAATPVPVAVDPATLTIDPEAARAAHTRRTRVVIACHLHGVCADVPALREHLPGVPVLEDAAQAFGSRLDGRRAGLLGEMAVLSLGPGKQLDAGEGGVLVSDTLERHRRAVAQACHPLRHLLSGLVDASPAPFGIRPHPVAAALALFRLANWDPTPARTAREGTLRALRRTPGVRVLGGDRRRHNARPWVPICLDGDHDQDEDSRPARRGNVRWVRSGAQVLPTMHADDRDNARRLLNLVRLARRVHSGVPAEGGCR
jgi:hypothetical protein